MGRLGPIFVLSTLIALGCAIPLWKNPGVRSDKIFWTIVLFVPVIGPILFFGAFHRSPLAQPTQPPPPTELPPPLAQEPPPSPPKTDVKPRCSFCGKKREDVAKMIAGPHVFICDECVDVCDQILMEAEEAPDKPADPQEASYSEFNFVCKFCGLPTSKEELLLVPKRGTLCLVCLDEIRSISKEREERWPDPHNR